jgi:hypothetical protein
MDYKSRMNIIDGCVTTLSHEINLKAKETLTYIAYAYELSPAEINTLKWSIGMKLFIDYNIINTIKFTKIRTNYYKLEIEFFKE